MQQSLGEHCVIISYCNFTEHYTLSIQPDELSQLFGGTYPVVDIIATPLGGKTFMHITNSNFKGNYFHKYFRDLDCSSICTDGIQNTLFEKM